MEEGRRYELPNDLWGYVGQQISKDEQSLKALITMASVSKRFHGIFQPIVNEANAPIVLRWVVEGNLLELLIIIKRNPALFFAKGDITAPREQKYFNVSGFQLMTFLCDSDMKNNIMPLIPDNFKKLRQDQYKEIDSGGADLIKLDFDPLQLSKNDFKRIRTYETTYTLADRPENLSLSLLKNPDGILCYKDNKGVVHFYYANCETETIKLLEPQPSSEKEQLALAEFIDSFATMENNSGRRSNDKEHQLIAQTMQYELQRKGIRYELNGIHYQNNRSEFRLINAYRTCIRLYAEAEKNGQLDKAHAYWRKVIGKIQGQEMWLLQWLCDKKPLVHSPFDYRFKRGFTIFNYQSCCEESVFDAGKLIAGLGHDFALYKDLQGGACRMRSYNLNLATRDLINICRLIEIGKKSIIESQLEENMQDRNLSR